MAQSTDWGEAELEASVDAYLKMLKCETEGTKYVKSKINAELRDGPLSARTKGSVEFRMQNISAVMQELGLAWIKGYKPAANVGEQVKINIKKVILKRDEISQKASEPSADIDEYRRRSEALRKLEPTAPPRTKPRGQSKPKFKTSSSREFYRDPAVRAWVLKLSKGNCEACGEEAPFNSEDGSAFLETHHMKRLVDDGPDIVENAVAICPNCHRRLHYSADRLEFAERVFEKVVRLERF
jgi:5-methylcytosine-specific restriction enzyme A